jgi:hypothetical protein
MRDFSKARAVVEHPFAWLWEPLEGEESFLLRAMFGAKAVYLEGKLMLCLMVREEPWRGVLVCTSREHQESLRADFPALKPHPVLPKWLYLPESAASFERDGTRLVERVRQRDARIGVIPKPRKARTRRPFSA